MRKFIFIAIGNSKILGKQTQKNPTIWNLFALYFFIRTNYFSCTVVLPVFTQARTEELYSMSFLSL